MPDGCDLLLREFGTWGEGESVDTPQCNRKKCENVAPLCIAIFTDEGWVPHFFCPEHYSVAINVIEELERLCEEPK
jgi:hypothetical protein